MRLILTLIMSLALLSCGVKSKNDDKEKSDKLKEFIVKTLDKKASMKIISGPEGVYPSGSPVFNHGKLRVNGLNLLDEKGAFIQLKGISSHGIQWYGEFVNEPNIDYLIKDFGINVFRVSMYTAEEGYLTNESLKEKVVNAVNICERLGIYVIIDWHMLLDNNPNMYIKESEEFFNEMSTLFAKKKHVLYEICNEPNGDDVTWEKDIKPYANTIIPVIRKNDPKSIILVGNSTWSSDVHIAAKDPLDFPNIMYTFHFYAGSHGKEYMEKVIKAQKLGAPVFVSEWGVTKASGDEGVFEKESTEWINFLDKNGISHINWSLSNKSEDCALLKNDTSYKSVISAQNLSKAGLLVKKLINIR